MNIKAAEKHSYCRNHVLKLVIVCRLLESKLLSTVATICDFRLLLMFLMMLVVKTAQPAATSQPLADKRACH